MTRNIALAPEEYYHIYNRGVDKRNIFENQNDYHRFLALLHTSNMKGVARFPKEFTQNPDIQFLIPKKDPLIDICSYCLMPNHFHLIVRVREDGQLSLFMQKLTTAYTMYFNKRNERSGALFQGTFKAKHVDTDEYLKYLIAYIHLNPVKLIEPDWKETGIQDRKRAGEYLDSYKYSSYKDFQGIERPQGAILTKGSLPEYFDAPTSFKEHIQGWLEFSEI